MKKKLLATLLIAVMIVTMLPAISAEAATMKQGSKGTEVKRLQQNLTLLGFSTGGVDSSYGNKTKNAVLKMQKELQMEEDGMVTDADWKFIKETVKDVQRYLKEKGYYSGSFDGIGGNGTQKALKKWQQANGYSQTGELTLAMMKKMLSDTKVKTDLNKLEEWVAKAEGTENKPAEIVSTSKKPKTEEEYVQMRLDELVEVLEGKYFTVDGKACLDKREIYKHSCENCLNVSVMDSDWFWYEFGTISFTNLPSQHSTEMVASNVASSDRGFTMFAQWFVYAADNDQKITCEKVASGIFEKEFVDKYVRPGDVLRLEEWQSVIVYSVEEDGIVVVDCNGDESDLNCRIRKRTLLYKGDYEVAKVIVDRVKASDVNIHKESKQHFHLKKSGELKITPKPTPTPKPTATPTPKPTSTPKPTATSTPKATATKAPTATPKPTAKPTATPKPTSSASQTSQITVQEKLDYLLEKLGADEKTVYFTVNRKACSSSRKSSHGCTNCNVADIVQTSWFKNMFGTVNINYFPAHDVNSSRRAYNGQSCFGFACFAQWYLFADSADENIVGQRVATIKFNKTNVQKYVRPGDVIRVNGHSVVVYSVESDGIWVVDSNWNTGGQLNCVVQKWFAKYTNSYMYGYTAYVNRPTKAKTLGAGMAGSFDMK